MSDQMMDDLTAMDELLTENPLLAKKLYSYSFTLTDPNEILENLRTPVSYTHLPVIPAALMILSSTWVSMRKF